MKEIVEILMRRDGMSKADAIQLYKDTKREIDEALALGNHDEVEDILASNLGLELDYIWNFI